MNKLNLVVAFVLFSIPTLSFSQKILSIDYTPIKYAYRSAIIQKENPPEVTLEAIGYFPYVYYKDIQLCACDKDEFYISPEGKYSVFFDNRDHAIHLFYTFSQKNIKIDRFIYVLEKVQWFHDRVQLSFQRNEVTGYKYPDLVVKL